VIIDSLLDTDLYKFTMMQVVLHQFPSAQSSTGQVPHARCRSDAGRRVDPAGSRGLCTLRPDEGELDYLRGCASSRATSSISWRVSAETPSTSGSNRPPTGRGKSIS